MHSTLEWTIIRPGGLTDGPKAESINPNISRANVAAFMVSQLTESAYLNQCVWLQER